jgi:L-amino acid N-acyltransferase YncA
MRIRKAIASDAMGIAKVQVDTWRTTYQGIVPDDYLDSMTFENREHKWKEILKEGTVYVAEEKGKVCGFSCGGKQRSENYPAYAGELYAIYLDQQYQRRGIGSLLLKPLLN